MATSPALVAAMVEAIGEPKVTVEVTLRRLRDAGLVPVGGRGPYAVQMDFASAMRLLLGVCASVPLEKDAAKAAITRFEHLVGGSKKSETIAGKGWDQKTTKLVLDHLHEEHKLGEALISLLRAGASNDLYISSNAKGKRIEVANPMLRGYLRVAFLLPIPIARIEHQVGNIRKVWQYGSLEGASLDSYISVVREKHLGGRKQITEIDGSSFEIIGGAVAS